MKNLIDFALAMVKETPYSDAKRTACNVACELLASKFGAKWTERKEKNFRKKCDSY